mmetsp:Transcript_7919/g.25999  ORF Transcript_7919/g.25999 Transcript_7919/m.25999 type:complete len:741 (-) Transcript_7919:227-2449(-)
MVGDCTAGLLAAAADRCAFARANCSEVGAGAFGSYVEHWHCTFAESGAALLPLGLWLAMLIAALCSTADTFLIPQLTYISNLLRLKPDVAGVTLLAFGNGAPDVFTGVAVATAHPEEVDFSLLLADIVGGSIFIMTVVVGAVVWVAAKHSPGWRLSRMPFYRDTISFFVAITLLLGVASKGIVYAWEGVFFLGNYVFYVVLVIAIRYYIQPCWPDDSFGIYLRGKAQPVVGRAGPALRAIRRRVGAHGIVREASRHARRAKVRASSFLSSAGAPLFAPSTGAVCGVPAGFSPLGGVPGALHGARGARDGGAAPLVVGLVGAPPSAAQPHRGVVHEPPMYQVEMVPRERDAASLAAERGASHSSAATASAGIPVAGVVPLIAAGALVHGAPPVCAHAVVVEEDFEAESVQVAQPVQSCARAYVSARGVDGVGGDNGCDSLVGDCELSGAEPGWSLMVGLEWEPETSRLSKALWLLESPLSVLRWASIPADGEWDWRRRRWAVATPPLASILMCIEVSGGVSEALHASAGAMPLVLVLPLACSPVPFALWRLSRDDVAPRWYAGLVVAGFVMSIVWLNLVATEVVALIETAGFLMGISTSILGLTVIAIGNSAGDLVSDIAAAKGGEAKMAVAACFGSPLLMNIIGAGASLTMRAISTGGADTESSVSQVCRIAYLFLYAALLSHMLVFPAGGYTATRRYAVYLFCLYGVFMLLALLAEGGLLGDFMCPRSAPCPRETGGER